MAKNRRMLKAVYAFVVFFSCTVYAADRIAELLALLEKRPKILIEALFIPTDQPQPLLRALIKHETQSIWAALYNLTEPEVAQDLLDAHNRGVDVQIIVDVEALRPKAEQVTKLYDNGVPVWLYAEYRSLMHDKYLLFANTIGNAPLLWTGSANVTKAGFKGNQENVVLLNDEETIQRYEADFERIKRRIRHAAAKGLSLRYDCRYEGNKLLVTFGRWARRFRLFK